MSIKELTDLFVITYNRVTILQDYFNVSDVNLILINSLLLSRIATFYNPLLCGQFIVLAQVYINMKV